MPSPRKKNYNILLKTRNNRKALLDLVNGNRVDAFIIRNTGLEAIDHDVLVALKRKSIPFIFIGKPPEENDCPAILVDNVGGGRQMAHHYAEHDFQKILFIAGPKDNLDSNDRIYGFKLGLSEKGLAPQVLDIVHGDFSRVSGYEAASEMIEKGKYEAVFAANDHMALGTIVFCRKAGIRVPEDLAVSGFDDTFFAEFLLPALTTVQQPMYEIGTVAMENIIQLLERPTQRERRIILPTRLQIRRSCGCNHDWSEYPFAEAEIDKRR